MLGLCALIALSSMALAANDEDILGALHGGSRSLAAKDSEAGYEDDAGYVADSEPGDGTKLGSKAAKDTAKVMTIEEKAAAELVATKKAKQEAKQKKRPEKAASKVKIVTFAPEANVTFGDDIDDDGGCSYHAPPLHRPCVLLRNSEWWLWQDNPFCSTAF